MNVTFNVWSLFQHLHNIMGKKFSVFTINYYLLSWQILLKNKAFHISKKTQKTKSTFTADEMFWKSLIVPVLSAEHEAVCIEITWPLPSRPTTTWQPPNFSPPVSPDKPDQARVLENPTKNSSWPPVWCWNLEVGGIQHRDFEEQEVKSYIWYFGRIK